MNILLGFFLEGLLLNSKGLSFSLTYLQKKNKITTNFNLWDLTFNVTAITDSLKGGFTA